MIDGASSPPVLRALADDVTFAVAAHVRLDSEAIRHELARRLGEPDQEYIWPRAERIAADLIDTLSARELVEACRHALAAAHGDFCARAATCLEAAADLEREGRDSWIARAIRHRLAFDAAWSAVVDEEREVECL